MKINIQKISKYISLIAVIMIIFSMIAIPSYADESVNWNSYISPVFLGTDSQATRYNGGLPFRSTSNSYRGSTTTSNLTVYQCLVTDGSSTYYTFLSETEGTPGKGYIIRPSGASYESYNANTIGHVGGIAYAAVYISGDHSSSATVPVFSSFDEAATSLNRFLNGGGGSSSPHELSLSIPAGNALVVDISNLSTVEINASITTEVAHPSSWYTNQYYSFMSSYPSSIGNRPSGANTINWTGFGQTTIFNRYKSFYWNNTVASSAGYICITNPYASLDEYDQSFNPTINVTFSQANGYKYYQLTGGISSDGNIGQQSDGTTASGTYDDSTGQWSTTNDETGLPWTPQEGGGNLITTNSINDWLKTIATQISNFFQGAIGAVTTLVNSGSAFINTLISLYAWLPAPVYAVLSSALILVITIGVIKVFI